MEVQQSMGGQGMEVQGMNVRDMEVLELFPRYLLKGQLPS